MSRTITKCKPYAMAATTHDGSGWILAYRSTHVGPVPPEDEQDANEALAALEEAAREGFIPWEQLKADLEL